VIIQTVSNAILAPIIQNFNKASKKSWGKLLPEENLPLISKGNIDFPPTFLTKPFPRNVKNFGGKMRI